MKTEEHNWQAYEAPLVECVEVRVEAGFEGSIIGSGNEAYEEESGSWDTI